MLLMPRFTRLWIRAVRPPRRPARPSRMARERGGNTVRKRDSNSMCANSLAANLGWLSQPRSRSVTLPRVSSGVFPDRDCCVMKTSADSAARQHGGRRDDVGEYVRESPLSSLAIAPAAGFLVGGGFKNRVGLPIRPILRPLTTQNHASPF